MPKQIDLMWVFSVIDEDGDEAVPAAMAESGVFRLLAGADIGALVSTIPVAVEVGRRLGKPIKLLLFTAREDVATVVPGEGADIEARLVELIRAKGLT